MSQTPIGLIGTLHISFSFHPLLNSLRTSTVTKLGAVRITNNLSAVNFRKNSTIAITQKPSVKRIAADLGNHRFVINNMSFLNVKGSTTSVTLSTLPVGLAASHYLLGVGKFIYCTENKSYIGTQNVESISEETLFSSQSFSTNSQTTTKENIPPSFTPSSPDKRPFSLFDLLNLQQITFGTSMGFASGYFVKALSKAAALTIGATFVFLRILEQLGYITICWNKFEENYNKMLDLDKDGKVTTNDFKLIFYKVVEFLGKNFQTDTSFIIGFGVGLRFG